MLCLEVRIPCQSTESTFGRDYEVIEDNTACVADQELLDTIDLLSVRTSVLPGLEVVEVTQV